MLKKVGSILLALVLLSGSGYAVVWLAAGVATGLRALNPNVAAALVTAATALLGILYSQRQIKAKDIAEGHRAEKVKVYRQFMGFVSKILASADELTPAQKERELWPGFKKEFIEFTSDFIIWASPSVLQKFEAWRVAAAASDTKRMLLAVDDLLQAMRKDLRNSNVGLKRGELMKMYLRDPRELDVRPN